MPISTQCEHLSDGKCEIASKHAGMPIVVNSSGCEACLANPNPKQMNHPMASMCVVAMIKADRFRTPEYREISKHIQSPEERCENTGTCKENAFGPGTELKEIVPKFFERGKCSCKSYAAKMDRWGVDECEQRFEEIVDHLVKQASGWAVPAFASRVVARRWLRMAIDNAKSDWPFVWAYYAKEAKGDELRYSIRSLLKWKPDARVILIGDKPDWYGGEFYEKPRIGPTSFQAFKDCYSKLQMAATIVDKFVWMMDDIYWVSDFKMYHATSPKYVRHVTQEQFYNWKPKNAWAKTRANAYSYLLENSLPTYDFAGHLPQPIRSKTFLEMEDELGLLEEYRNWECIYFNKYYSQHAIPYASKYTRVTKEPKRISPKGVLLNHTSSTYGGMVREYLESAFPEKCAVEK